MNRHGFRQLVGPGIVNRTHKVPPGPVVAGQHDTKVEGRHVTSQGNKGGLPIRGEPGGVSFSAGLGKELEFPGHGVTDVVDASVWNAGTAQEAIAGSPNFNSVSQEIQRQFGHAPPTVNAEQSAGVEQNQGIPKRHIAVEAKEVCVADESEPELANASGSDK